MWEKRRDEESIERLKAEKADFPSSRSQKEKEKGEKREEKGEGKNECEEKKGHGQTVEHIFEIRGAERTLSKHQNNFYAA